MPHADGDSSATLRQMAHLQRHGWTFKTARNGVFIRRPDRTTAYYGKRRVEAWMLPSQPQQEPHP